MRWRIPLWLLLGLSPWCAAAVPPEFAATAAKFASTPKLKFAPLDLAKLDAEDAIADKLAGQPMRFAVAQSAARTPANSGLWSQEKDGNWVWRLAIEAKDAAHLNFAFTRFNLPLGAELLIVDAEGDMALGPYTAKDRLPHGQLWTPILFGDRALIELRVPAAERDRVDLELGQVNQGYRGFGVKSPACKSGACNTDVACLGSSDPWNEPRRAVGAYTRNGTDTCTGSLLNNTRNDGRMLFATASHCNIRDDSGAASVVVYWNYESPTCRTPGSTDSGTALPKPTSTTQGLRFLAATDSISGSAGTNSSRSDWTLLELATPPANNTFNLYWAGWDRSAPPMTCSAPASASSTSGLCAGIHHPNVDEKRITFVETSLTRTSYNSGSTNLHWDARWDPTPPILPNISPVPSSLPPSVTEPGSSGSPLYNAERRMIGVLSGGPSACGATGEDLRDYYGGLFHAWDGNGTATTRMRDYLDPTNSGVTRIDGFPRTSSSFTVQLSSAAFSAGVAAGSDVAVSAAASGGSGSLTYEWDADGDGVYERSSSASSISVRYPRALNPATIAVRVRDASGTMTTSSRTFEVRGPSIAATANGAPSEVCGNGDSVLDPGERWQLPVRLNNSGSGGLGSGHALFAAASGATLELGPNQFGYRGSRQAASCAYNFIDIASGSNATSSLTLTQADDGRAADAIALGGRGILLYGQRYTQAVMSTNGYISFANADSGGDYRNDCTGGFGDGGLGPQIRPLHDDLVVSSSGGLRYRYFASCPRNGEAGTAGQGCHVFQWSRMQLYTSSSTPPSGDFEFQAVVYEDSGAVTYQYRSADPNSGAGATIGLVDSAGADPFNAACNAANSAPAASAICLFAPSQLPSSTPTLRVQAAAPAVSGIAAGQTATVNVPFQVLPSASCGAALGIDYIASADSALHSFNRASVYSATIASSCRPVTSCPATRPNLNPRRGLHFNAARPGNGLNSYFYDIGNDRQIYGSVWYTGLADQTSTWYLVNGEVSDYAGQMALTRVRNAGAPSSFRTETSSVGRAWVAQLDDDSVLLAWQFDDGRSGAERMDTISTPLAATNHTQAWYNTGESGWGVAIESLAIGSGFEFFAAYIYDASGNPRWLVGDKSSTGNGQINMTDQRVHCPACAWYIDYAGQARAAGAMNIQYNSRTSAILSTDLTLASPLSGSWRRENLPIVAIAEPRP